MVNAFLALVLGLLSVPALADSTFSLKPGDQVTLTPGSEVVVSCGNSSPEARTCLVQNCGNDAAPFAIRYSNGDSVTGLCYATPEDVEKMMRVLRSDGQCK